MKRFLIAAAALLSLSAGAAFAQSAAPGTMSTNPSVAGAGGYLFPNEAEEPFAPQTIAPAQEPGAISHIFLFPPADDGEAASG